jgi:hypothetical protein
MHDTDITNCDALPNKMKIDLNVFGVLMFNQVGGHVDGASIVAVYQGSTIRRCMQLE